MQQIAAQKQRARERGEEAWARDGGWITGMCLSTGIGGALGGLWVAVIVFLIGAGVVAFHKWQDS